jgi:hypothetical protein
MVALICKMARQDRIDKYRAIVLGKRKATAIQEAQLKKYKYAFALLCEGFSPLQITQQILNSDFDIHSMASAYKVVRECMLIFGNASKYHKQGLRSANYERLMKLARLCEGFSPLQITQQILNSDFDIHSMASAYKVVRECMLIFGNASKYHKQGLRSANYERLMKLARLCEEKGDYATTRLLIKDANELMGLMKDDEDMFEDAQDWMKPEAFVVITDPNQVDAAQRMIEMEIPGEETEFEDVDDEEGPEEGKTDLPHS